MGWGFLVVLLLSVTTVIGAGVKIYNDHRRNKESKDFVKELEAERELDKELNSEGEFL